MSEGGSPPQTTSKHDIFLTVDYHDDYSVIRRRDMRSGGEEQLRRRHPADVEFDTALEGRDLTGA